MNNAPRLSHPTDRPNLSEVRIGGILFGFSYSTLVHVSGPAGTATRENDWGPTTGKHLNHFDGGRKAERVDAETFQRMVDANLAAVRVLESVTA